MVPYVTRLDLPHAAIAAYCHRWQVAELAVFGSVLRDDVRENSDVDLLVTFEDGARRSLFDLVTMQVELKAILGCEVNLMTRRGVEQSHNPIRRNAILQSTRSIYRAA